MTNLKNVNVKITQITYVLRMVSAYLFRILMCFSKKYFQKNNKKVTFAACL